MPGVPGWRGRGLCRSGINPFRAADSGDCGPGWERLECLSPKCRPPNLALAMRVYLLSVFKESVGVLSLRLSVVVLSLWLVWTLGFGEGYSYSEAKVEVRVYCDPTAGEQV